MEGGFVVVVSKFKIVVCGGGYFYIGVLLVNGVMVFDLLGLLGGVYFDSVMRNVWCWL